MNVSTILHGNDSELIFFVDPDEEGLVFVVVDTSARWPVSVEIASFKESVTLLEKEMVSDKLVLNSFIHTLEWVECSFEITCVTSCSLDDSTHDIKSLLLGDTWTKWVISEVSANSNSSRLNVFGIIFVKGWGIELRSIHVGFVDTGLVVTMVVFDDWVKKLFELSVGFVGSSIDTNARVGVSDTRVNISLEGDTILITLVFVLFPNFFGQVLAESGLAAFWEGWEFYQVISRRFDGFGWSIGVRR